MLTGRVAVADRAHERAEHPLVPSRALLGRRTDAVDREHEGPGGGVLDAKPQLTTCRALAPVDARPFAAELERANGPSGAGGQHDDDLQAVLYRQPDACT